MDSPILHIILDGQKQGFDYKPLSNKSKYFQIISNIVPVHEPIWDYFEPVRKIGNKEWQSKHDGWLVLQFTKKNYRLSKDSYCIFFSCDGIVAQILVARGKKCYRSMLPRFYLLVYKKFRTDLSQTTSLFTMYGWL